MRLRHNRVDGLKILLFAPKLKTHCLNSSDRYWCILETEIRKEKLLSDIEEAVNLNCPDWFEILKAAYSDHLSSFLISQGDDSETQVESISLGNSN